MSIFVDTSAILPLMDAGQPNHLMAQKIWREAVIQERLLYSTNYVIVETTALLQNRLGVEAVQLFQENVVPFFQIIWVQKSLHQAGITALLLANRRQVSLVDCISFAAMRQLGLHQAFAFDKHFAEQGFSLLA